ncbi:MAG: efflux RND transporter permease subunit, partial [Phycisphaerales bacterium]
RDGFSPQTSMVHVDGVRSSLLTILKSTGYSTLDIVSRVKETLPKILNTIPPGVDVKLLLDQSIFVRAAIGGVLKEAAIAGGLTALMILLFLGSWRSTVIIAISIPLAMIASVICLAAMGHTINTMTLGGLGLAVGVLVDDATVEIENIHRNLAQRKPILRAILDGAQQIAVPAFVSTLVICIVFLPVFFISGSAKFLFVPLSLAVVFAMLASYILSRTLVPTMARTLLAPEVAVYSQGEHASGTGPIWAVHRVFNAGFEWFKGLYELALAWVLSNRLLALVGFAATVGVGALGVTQIGQDFFPTIDSGQIRLHVRCPAGTRIESSEQYFLGVEDEIRQIIPASDLGTIIDNIGLPAGGVNLAFSDSSTVSAADGEILISLTPDRIGKTADYVKAMRSRLAATYPDLEFFFQSPDIVSQILNFGLAAPIDIQVTGPNKATNQEFAQKLIDRIEKIPGATDVHTQQVVAAPEISVDIDRTRAVQAGLTQRDVASSVLTSLSGTGQAAPNYWLNPKNGVNYLINVQTPQYRVGTLEDLAVTPLSPGPNTQGQLIEGLATTHRTVTPVAVGHYNIQSVTDVLVSVEGSDLGRVGRDVDKVIEEIRKELPKNTQIIVRGQYLSMRDSFNGLAAGLVGAILLAYFLMVVNFQSWTDPLIIVTALPGALAGVVAMLLLTHTTLNVPSLMGTIMCVGVATSNSILLVTFANDYRRDTGVDAIHAAWAAGRTRLRPVLMTAAAMIIGMVPMAIGLGEGGEQNAPLGRAVIGGLLFATVATLLIVPVFYSILRKNVPVSHDDLEKEVSLA